MIHGILWRPCPILQSAVNMMAAANKYLWFTTLLLVVLCSQVQALPAPSLVPVNNNAFPQLTDDDNYQNLNQAIEQSLHYLQTQPTETSFIAAGRVISNQDIKNSLTVFQKILALKLPPQAFRASIKKRFDMFQATGTTKMNADKTMLITGYYQPVVEGCLHKQAPYLYPLYAVPPDLVVRSTRGGHKQIGRIHKGHFIRYWTREEIDTQGKAAGHELVWLKDPLDVFFLHVQGSGVIRLRNGQLRTIRFARKNGLPYRSIGKFMVKTKRITLAEASMATIRSYIRAHPEERDTILFTNPSYIFFTWAKQPGAVGNLGQQLTPGRSVAADQHCFPAGALAYLQSREPVVQNQQIISWKPAHRFVLIQDSGSAILGPGRIDIFWGAGPAAGAKAGAMKEPGNFFLFLLKDS